MYSEEQLNVLLTETEKLNLREARNSLYDFSAVMALEPMPVAHHKLICNKLDQVADKVIRRLMILMPPGYAKSTYASVLFPPYYMAKYPRRKIVAGSYNTELAEYFGKKARDVAGSPRFAEIWHETLHPGAGRAKSEWGLTNNSEYYGTGVGSGVTGRRSDIILIDDPFKSRKEADSPTVRKDTWNWYMTDIRSRAKPDCGIVIINTRWHEDDICGRILNWGPEPNIEEKPVYVCGSGVFEAYDGELWEVLSLPAIAEPHRIEGNPRPKSRPLGKDALGREEGEVLWPEYYTEKAVYQERKSQDDRNWAALWQCRPSPEEGDFFKRDHFKFFGTLPHYMRIYGSSDYAVTKDTGDFTELGIFGVDDSDNIFVFDWWFGKENSLVWMENLFRLQKEHNCSLWFEEKGQIEKSMGPIIGKTMAETGIYFSQHKIAMKHDKVMRAQSIRARMAQGKVFFPAKGSPYWGKWVDHVIGQMMVFDAGTNDDAVDVMSLLGLGLGQIIKSHIPLAASPKPGYLTFDEMCRDEPAPKSAYRL